MGAPMTSKTGLATPQFGQQGLGQWGQAHPGGLQQLGQSIGGGYKPMPFNVNMGQGLGSEHKPSARSGWQCAQRSSRQRWNDAQHDVPAASG
jgi:hypothetical protein